MAGNTTFDTYASVGIREDLSDVIYNIAPTDTPFVSNVGSGTAKGTYHEWQKDTLATAVDLPQIEGDDATAGAIVATTRLHNYTQINEKTFIISGTDLVADNAGRGVEMAYQEAKKGLELKKDIEYTCVGVNRIAEAGEGWAGTEAARKAGTVQGYISTCTDKAAVVQM